MSLMRALTKRSKRPEISPLSPTRAGSVRQPGQSIDRSKISSPVALISSTSALSYDAPDIATMRHVSPSSTSTASSRSSVNDSDASSTSNRSLETLTDASSVDSPPPSPNHLSCYFEAANPPATKTVRRSQSSVSFREKTVSVENALAPAIPQRALSHSKKAHEQLARKRSLQHMKTSSVDSLQRTSYEYRASREPRIASIDMFTGSVEPHHPFGKELEQLDEVAEEFTSTLREAEMDEDTRIIQQKGLMKFCAADYMMEIQPLFTDMFGTAHHGPEVAWI